MGESEAAATEIMVEDLHKKPDLNLAGGSGTSDCKQPIRFQIQSVKVNCRPMGDTVQKPALQILF